jgi:DNA-binding PadR family transcriptional regulator
MARVNKSQFAILGCLSFKPMSAYEIKQFLLKSAAHFWSEAEAQLYPTLKKLSAAGLVSFKEEKAAKAGNKKVYDLTEPGMQALKGWLSKKAEQPVFRNELLLKLFFGAHQSDENNIEIIRLERQDLQATYDLLEQIQISMQQKQLSPRKQVYMQIVINYGLTLLKAELDWCDRSMQQLKQLG